MRYKTAPFGEIPSHWQIKSIEEIAEVVTDYVANGSFASLKNNVQYLSESDYAVLIRLVDFNKSFSGDFVYINKSSYDFLKKSLLFGGEIIISNVGANVGTVFKTPNLNMKMALAPNSVMLRTKYCDDFYFHWLKSRYGQHMISAIISGSAQPKFNKTEFRKMLVPVPPIEEQREIANILNSYDKKIQLNKQINHHLAEQISLIYNLAITTQKVTTKTIDEVTVKNEDIIAVSKINSNNYVSTTNMISDKSGINNNITLPSTQYVKAFHPKDILISNIRPYFKKIWYSNKSGGHSADVLNFRANTAIISPEILWAYLYQDSFFDAVTKSAKGTKMPRGDKNAIMKFKISIPANSKELTTTIRPILSLIAENNRQNYNLENLKSSLLPKLLSGELSVNQATK